jgi:hypothetical protein
MLVGRAGGGHEQLVAAGPVARALARIARIFPGRGCALALARRFFARRRQLTLPLSLTIALTLLAATFLAVLAGAVALAGPPTPPAPGCLLTDYAAIVAARLRGPEPAFTALEQAAPAAVGTVPAQTLCLTRPRKAGKLLRAHGRQHSRAVKSRGEVVSFPPRRLCPSPVGGGEEARVTLPFYPTACTGPTLRASLRSAARRLAPAALRKWLTVWLPLTSGLA